MDLELSVLIVADHAGGVGASTQLDGFELRKSSQSKYAPMLMSMTAAAKMCLTILGCTAMTAALPMHIAA
jgi:hypothetical protein